MVQSLNLWLANRLPTCDLPEMTKNNVLFCKSNKSTLLYVGDKFFLYRREECRPQMNVIQSPLFSRETWSSYLNFCVYVPADLDRSVPGLSYGVDVWHGGQGLDPIQIHRTMACRATAGGAALFRLGTIKVPFPALVNAIRGENIDHSVVLGRLAGRTFRAAAQLLRYLQFLEAFLVITIVRFQFHRRRCEAPGLTLDSHHIVTGAHTGRTLRGCCGQAAEKRHPQCDILYVGGHAD